jgi:tetratricopeptide (TPR) repeat protein
MIWLRKDPLYAMPALREAMQRHKNKANGPRGFYSGILQHMRALPELRQPLLDLATEPTLKLVYLQFAVTEEDFKKALGLLLEQQPSLASLGPTDQKVLFRLWYQRGDKAALVKALEENPQWKVNGWLVLADDRASKGDFEGAYALATDYLPKPAVGESLRNADLAQLRRDFLFNPTDIARGIRLAAALRSKSLLDEALSTLDKVSGLPGAPASVFYEQALIFARKSDYQKAWDRLKAYIDTLPRDS